MTNEIAPLAMTAEEITAILAAAGAVDEESQTFLRVKVDGQSFVASDDNIWFSNPKTKEPAFTARLMEAPVQFQSYWFDAETAIRLERPDMANRFCRSTYDNPNEGREFGTNGYSCRQCPVNPFSGAKPKCSWKGDLRFQVVPDDGTLTGDEPIYTMTLSTTAMIQWRGTKVNPKGGSATDENFMHQLAKLAIQNAPTWGLDAQAAIVAALTALANGMVAAEFRIARMTNEENSQSWSVPVITPVHIEMGLADDNAKLEAGDSE